MKKYDDIKQLNNINVKINNSINIRKPIGETLDDVYKTYSNYKKQSLRTIKNTIYNIRWSNYYNAKNINAYYYGITAANTMQYTYDWVLKIENNYYLIRETRCNTYAKLLTDDEVETVKNYSPYWMD